MPARRPDLRPADRVYPLKKEHVELLRELDRLFPDRAPIVDFARIPAGVESVELVSRQLHEALLRRFEQPLFVAACHVNAERMLDVVRAMIERGAYPLVADEVLADVFVAYYQRLRGGPERMRAAGLSGVEWREPSEEWSLLEMLATVAEALIAEQVHLLANCELPLPGLKLPPLDPGEKAMARAAELLQSLECTIPVETARHWVAHALLRLPPERRRVLFLRERLGLPLDEVARRMGLRPFEAGLLARSAWLELREAVARTSRAFAGVRVDRGGEEGGGERAGGESARVIDLRRRNRDASKGAAMGRLLKLSPRGAPTPRRGRSESEHETEGDADS